MYRSPSSFTASDKTFINNRPSIYFCDPLSPKGLALRRRVCHEAVYDKLDPLMLSGVDDPVTGAYFQDHLGTSGRLSVKCEEFDVAQWIITFLSAHDRFTDKNIEMDLLAPPFYICFINSEFTTATPRPTPIVNIGAY